MHDEVLPQPPDQITLMHFDLLNSRNNQGRRSATHELIYSVRDSWALEVAGRRFHLTPGEAVYLPRGVFRRLDFTRDGSAQVFLLWFNDDRFGLEPWVVRDANGRLLVALHWLRDHTPIANDSDRLLHRCLLGAIFCELTALRGGVVVSDRDPVQQTMEFLRKNHEYPTLNLRDVCAVVQLGRTALIRRFREATGQSPMAWLQRLRTSKAFDLLVGSRLPVLDIAKAVGFKSAEHLSRLMRRHYGRPPRELRKSPQPAAVGPHGSRAKP